MSVLFVYLFLFIYLFNFYNTDLNTQYKFKINQQYKITVKIQDLNNLVSLYRTSIFLIKINFLNISQIPYNIRY